MAAVEGGRAIPGRLSLSLTSAWPAALAAGAAVLVVLTRVPFRTRFLLNWDAVQFALGMAHFDVVHHQPHPPGYPGYLALGRAVEPLVGDANAALVILSIAGEAAGVVLATLFAASLFGRRAAAVTGLAMVTSPLFWYYGEAANTYALEPALVLGIAWCAWRCWNRVRAFEVPVGVVVAAAGAVRPSTAVLMAPLVAVALWRSGRATGLVRGALAGAAVTACWLVPMLAVAGGPAAYARAGLSLGGDVTTSTAIWSAGLSGLRTTGDAVLRGVLWELGAFAVLVAFGLGVAPRLLRRGWAPPGWAGFAVLWAAPGLATFLLVHIGQVVYVQQFTPLLFLCAGPAASLTAEVLGRPALWRPLTAGAAAISVVTFLLPPHYSLAAQLAAHDSQVAALQAVAPEFDPAHTVLVCDAYAIGSYRTAQYYLPAFHRAGVGVDRSGRLGEVFADVYEPDGPAGQFGDPGGATTWVFLDRSIVSAYVADPERLRPLVLADGSRAWVWQGGAPRIAGNRIWLGQPYPPSRGRDA